MSSGVMRASIAACAMQSRSTTNSGMLLAAASLILPLNNRPLPQETRALHRMRVLSSLWAVRWVWCLVWMLFLMGNRTER